MNEQSASRQVSEPAAESNPAETYESYMVPALFEPWAARLIEAAAPRPGERVLDCACGTGIVARRLAHLVPGGRVDGVDPSSGMLTVARAAAEREDVAVEWHEGRAEELPFAEQRFDLALCQFALMFFDEPAKALAEMHRVLARDGRIALAVFQDIDRHPFYQRLDNAIQRQLGVPGVQQIFAFGDEDRLLGLLTDAGFAHVQIDPVSLTARFPNPAAFLAGEIDVDTASIPSMQHLDQSARAAVIDAISEEMQAPLQAVTEGDHVVMPFHALIVTATASEASGGRGGAASG